MPKKNCVTGTIRVHPRGFGFLQPSEGEEIFIPKRKMRGAVDKDEVEVLVNPHRSEKGYEGEIKKVLKRGRDHVAGTIALVHGKHKTPYAFVPLLCSDELMRIDAKGLKEGDRIIIHVQHWGSRTHEPHGEMVALLGHIKDPSCDVPAAIEEFELEGDFPQEVVEEARAFGKKVCDDPKRTDLRSLECITIDPATAKDFDDALSLSEDPSGHFHLGVHIADVSYYVRPGTALDREARVRCNSTYLPGVVVPMLPHELSSHLCSLMPKVDRFALSVLVTLDASGEVVDYKIERSVIHSKMRFSYEEAKEVLDGTQKSPHLPLLERMVRLCHLLKKKRYERGSIEFALPDTHLTLDKKGMPTGVEVVEYDITHQLVEEFMLKANEIVATHLSKLGKPLTYRIHDAPFEENLKEFAATATALGFPLPENPSTEDLQTFFDHARESPLGKFFATSFIRTMKLASYSTENVGHYGLGLEHYTHFTSPIRRYIDLIIHRLALGEESDEDLEAIAKACSEKERLSSRAENSIIRLKKLRLLQKLSKTREAFDAVVTSVKPVGFSFEVESLLIEGFLAVSDFEEYYTYDPSTRALKSDLYTYRTGDHLNVYPEEIDLITGDVLWCIIDDA